MAEGTTTPEMLTWNVEMRQNQRTRPNKRFYGVDSQQWRSMVQFQQIEETEYIS